MADLGRSFSAPAKLNLFLHITGRRDNGYHDLQTVFQFIDLCDQLSFQINESGQIKRENDLGFPEDHDLTIRAAKLLQEKAQTSQGALIHIEKNIPTGGGLGGGSSNAATALVVLNQLWQCGFTKPELADLGLQLGADVPIFVHGHAAWAEGVGERIQAITPPEDWFLVLAPEIHVSTAEIFADSGLTRNTLAITIRDLDEATNWFTLRNDCEQVVRQKYPLINDAIEFLSTYGHAKLTGTGACCFVAFAAKDLALAAQEALNKQTHLQNVKSFVVRGLNQSPLHQQL